MRRVIDLDAADDVVIVTTYGGLKTALTKARLEELLRCEQEYLASLTTGAAPAPAAAAPEAPAALRYRFDASNLPPDSVTHASLSTRIKKIHTFAKPTRKLRDAHVGFLRELLQSFDWVIPEHPNTKLEVQLQEMLAWRGVPEDFKALAAAFLERYRKARGLPPA